MEITASKLDLLVFPSVVSPLLCPYLKPIAFLLSQRHTAMQM
uniref:Uncharacterized protein n=1 Tax=Anguilla anguilla TaxID=7936 RepID=A0A0E9W335_ANGAN